MILTRVKYKYKLLMYVLTNSEFEHGLLKVVSGLVVATKKQNKGPHEERFFETSPGFKTKVTSRLFCFCCYKTRRE